MIPLQGSVREKLDAADTAFAARPLREKLMLAAMVVALVLFSIDLVVIQPIADDRHLVEIGTDRTRASQASKQDELASLFKQEMSDDERRVFAETELVQKQIAEIEKQMALEIEGLVPPRAIVAVLEELLEATPGLRLLHLESAPPYEIGGDASSESETLAGVEKLYRHGVRVKIEGDFPSTLDYLERVEQSEWHLMWDALDYQVETYPTATITIDFHTISRNEEWIGV